MTIQDQAIADSEAVEAFARDWREWHRLHEARLADAHGFLAITGLYWLDETPQRFEDAPGRWSTGPEGVRVVLDEGEELVVDGVPVHGEYGFGVIAERASLFPAWGDAVIEVAKRGGHDIVRPRHPGNRRRVEFAGTPAYEPDLRWALIGRYVPFDAPRPTTVGAAVEGLAHVYDAPGRVEFEFEGRALSLTAFNGRAPGSLTVLFTDATSGVTTYAANRSLQIGPPAADGTVLLDFNRAANLPLRLHRAGHVPAAARREPAGDRRGGGREDPVRPRRLDAPPGRDRADRRMNEFLWYIPNTVEPGHRGDDTTTGWGSIDYSTRLARAAEEHGWGGALLGTGWGRPDTFTVATALASRTTTFKPLIAIRPGYWQPANFASAAATLDQLSRGRVLVNIVSGLDNLAAYGDVKADPAQRYARTREFMLLLRRLWTEEAVTFAGEHFQVRDSTVAPRPYPTPERPHPTLYFGGASEAAERVAAAEADVQLFWGEPLQGLAERIERLRALSERIGRRHRPLEFGLRITTLVRDTTEEAWRDAERKVEEMASGTGEGPAWHPNRTAAVGQQRLYSLVESGEVLDSCLYTTPGRYGGGGAATTWLVGSADDVATALENYRRLGITHFVLSDTPYAQEIARVGDQLLPLLRSERVGATRTRQL